LLGYRSLELRESRRFATRARRGVVGAFPARSPLSLSVNINRRHMTAAQRAMATAMILSEGREGRQGQIGY
jgi:hypothetical protein